MGEKLGLVNRVEELIVDVDEIAMAVELGELGQHVIEIGAYFPWATVDFVQQPLDPCYRVIEVHRRVDHEDLAKIENPPLLIQLGHKGSMGSAQAVAAEVEVGHLDISLHLAPGILHHPVEVHRVFGQIAGNVVMGSRDDEVRVGGGRQGKDMVARFVELLHHRHDLLRPVAGAGSDDQENQRRFLILIGQGAAQPLIVKKDIRLLEVRDDVEDEVPDRYLGRGRRFEIVRGPQDRSIIGARNRVAIPVIRRLADSRQQDKAENNGKCQVFHAIIDTLQIGQPDVSKRRLSAAVLS